MRYQTMDLLIKMSRLLQHKKAATTFLVINFAHVTLVHVAAITSPKLLFVDPRVYTQL